MAVTARLTPSPGVWTAVATAGEVIATPTHEAVWAVTGNATPPAFDGGHMASFYNPAVVTLTGSERLWVKPVNGAIFVTADAPV